MTQKPSDIAPEIPELPEERQHFPGPDDTGEANDREDDAIKEPDEDDDEAIEEPEGEGERR